MRQIQIFVKEVNPEPWTVPELGIGRSGGKVFATATTKKPQRLYQTALKEVIAAALPPDFEMYGDDERLDLRIVAFRTLEAYVTPKGAVRHRQRVDATNVQKATEDALQKIIFKNDSQIARASCEIVNQDAEQECGIYILIRPYAEENGWEAARKRLAGLVPMGHLATVGESDVP